MVVDVRFLGGLEVHAGDAPASLGGPQAGAVFALLATNAGRVLSTSQLIDELWPEDPPRDARGTIQTHIATIRRGLADERHRLRTADGGYVLDLDADELDAARFTRLAQEGRNLLRDDARAAEDRLEAALSEWLGAPLPGLDERAPRLQVEAARLHELRLGVVEDLAQARLELSEPARAVADLEPVVAAEPFRERSVALLLRALADEGRQAEALARYDDHRRRLGEELGVDPSAELKRLHLDLISAATTSSGDPATRGGVPSTRPGHLPSPVTRFFGREADRDALVDLLMHQRLVTIVGVGGGGKTRLAVEVARLAGDAFPEGLHFVDLAPVRDDELVPRAIADAVGVALVPYGGSVHEQTVRTIGERRVLLLLDNCEHLLGACAEGVVRLLDRCPRLTVLATSREPLGVDGEHRWRLDPLALPEVDGRDDAASLQLLVDRAQAVRQDFQVADDNREAVVAICRRLDGLPLALELVAARFEHLSPIEIAERLEARPTALVSGQQRVPRHATLDTVIGWSHELLPEAEQVLLRRLSVFGGGADLTAIAAVAGGGHDDLEVLELVANLVRRSLVTATEVEGATRYGLLETVRDFAGQRLRDAGEAEAVRLAHRDHYLDVLESVPWDQRMFSLHRGAPRLEVELGNVGAAFDASMARGEHDVAARLAVGAPALIIANQRWDELDRWLATLWDIQPDALSLPERLSRARYPEHVLQQFWLEVWRMPWSADDLREALALLHGAAGRLPELSPAHIHINHVLEVGAVLAQGADLDVAVPRLRKLAEDARDMDAPLLHAAILEETALAQLLGGRYEDALTTLQRFSVFEVAVHFSKPLLTLAAAQHLVGDHDGAIRTVHHNLESVHPGARSLVFAFLAIARAGAGDRDAARNLLRLARDEHDLLAWQHPRSLNNLLVAFGACAAMEGRRDVAANLLAAAGSPDDGFAPLNAVHRHYTEVAGPPDPATELPPPSDTAALEELVDAELLRWARTAHPDCTSPGIPVPFVDQGASS